MRLWIPAKSVVYGYESLSLTQQVSSSPAGSGEKKLQDNLRDNLRTPTNSLIAFLGEIRDTHLVACRIAANC